MLSWDPKDEEEVACGRAIPGQQRTRTKAWQQCAWQHLLPGLCLRRWGGALDWEPGSQVSDLASAWPWGPQQALFPAVPKFPSVK